MPARKFLIRVREMRAARKQRARPWPLLILRVGNHDHPSMGKIRRYFEARGFSVEVRDARFQGGGMRRPYKMALIVAATREDLGLASVVLHKELAATNRILFIDSELETFVEGHGSIRTRSKLIKAIIRAKGGRRAVGKEIFYSSRSEWLQKLIEGRRSELLFALSGFNEDYFWEEETKETRSVGPAINARAGIMSEPADKLDVGLAAWGTSMFALGMVTWTWFAQSISFDGVAAVVILLAGLNLLRPVTR